MKVAYLFMTALLLSGCNGFVDDPDTLIKRLRECESVGMESKIVSTVNNTVLFLGCTPKVKQ